MVHRPLPVASTAAALLMACSPHTVSVSDLQDLGCEATVFNGKVVFERQ